MLSCPMCRERLDEVALLSTEDEVPPEVQEHLNVCSHCCAELVKLRQAWCLLSASLHELPVDVDQLEQRLLTRIEASSNVPEPQWSDTDRASHSRSMNVLRYVLAVTVLVGLIVGTWSIPHWLERSAGEVTRDELRQIQELASRMDHLRQIETTFASPDVRYVSLVSASDDKEVSASRAYLVLDVPSGQGHLLAEDLQPLPGQIDVLWLLDREGRVLARQPIDISQQRFNSATFSLPSDVSVISEVLITSETERDAPSPSGRVQMRASVDE